MIQFNGIVQFISQPRKAGEKQVVDVMVMQRAEGFRPEVLNLAVWSDNNCFADSLRLQPDSEVQVKANPICEKRNGTYTGQIKYTPLEIVAI